MTGLVRIIAFLLTALFAFVAADCISDCYYASIPQTGCPGAADPNAPITVAYEQCVCPTCNLKTYTACVKNNCNNSGVGNFFNSICAQFGGGTRLTMRATEWWFKHPDPSRKARAPNGRSVAELQARVARPVRLAGRESVAYDMTGRIIEASVDA
ncbi:hypothetical protein BKA62DRAFT_689404 [Auriculariales sp. MPI-PUGE-AT-0066]|nr:hypothetical protein BKA62DRAFT_689404 [Auriculariales sp. MPI-PUGE-AT-0066]